MVTLKQWFLRCTPKNSANEETKSPTFQAYIKEIYPAILRKILSNMVEKGTDNKYRPEKE